MPRGSDYEGPARSLELYAAVVDAAVGDVDLKGAKNPYTARNGHMFSFLDGDGNMALRLSDELRDQFLEEYQSGPVIQYGSVMRGYVFIPDTLLTLTDELGEWFQKSYDWTGTLEAKPTKK
jgi:hypothetical protein